MLKMPRATFSISDGFMRPWSLSSAVCFTIKNKSTD
jgi:hypothetical protein